MPSYKRSALVRRAPADLVVACGEHVLPGQAAIGTALGTTPGTMSTRFRTLRPLSGSSCTLACRHHLAEGCVFGLQQRRFGGHLATTASHRLPASPHPRERGFHVHLDLVAGVVLKTFLLNIQLVIARHQVDKPVDAVRPGSRDRRSPVPTLVNVTFAPCKTAPAGSVTNRGSIRKRFGSGLEWRKSPDGSLPERTTARVFLLRGMSHPSRRYSSEPRLIAATKTSRGICHRF